jgi:hypothetical protein
MHGLISEASCAFLMSPALREKDGAWRLRLMRPTRLLDKSMHMRHQSVSATELRPPLQRPLHILQRIRIVERGEIAGVVALRERE